MPKRKKGHNHHGAGSHWYDKKNKRHFWRIIVNGHEHTVSDSDPERALAKFETLKQNLKDNIVIGDGKQSLDTLSSYWLECVKKPDVKESSIVTYHRKISVCVSPILGGHRICDLTDPIIRQWLATVVSKFALSSTRQALTLLKEILDYAVEQHMIPFNPAKSIKPPRKVEEIVNDEDEIEGVGRVMTAEQVEAFLAAVKGTWLEPLYILGFSSGSRRGELLGPRWSDYDSENKTLRIRQQVVQIGTAVKITTPKTPSSRRVIPLIDEYAEMLNQHRVRWLERKMKHRNTWNDSYDLIFCSENGTPITPSNLLRDFRAALKRAGLVEIDAHQKAHGLFRFHDIRHTASQNMEDAGIADKVRAAILGHANINTTREVYTHASEAAKRDAMQRVNQRKAQ